VAIRVETGIRYHRTDSAGRFVVDMLPPERTRAGGGGRNVAADFPAIRVELGAATQLTFKLRVAGPRNRSPCRTIAVETNPSSISALVDDKRSRIALNGDGSPICCCWRRE